MKQPMPSDLPLRILIARRKAAKRHYNERKTFGNEHATLYVTKTRRGVRLTVVQHERAVNANIVLTPEEVPRLVRRLAGIDGGRQHRRVIAKARTERTP